MTALFLFSSSSEREAEPPDPKRRHAAALQKGSTAAPVCSVTAFGAPIPKNVVES
jgi:hypothetical protein